MKTRLARLVRTADYSATYPEYRVSDGDIWLGTISKVNHNEWLATDTQRSWIATTSTRAEALEAIVTRQSPPWRVGKHYGIHVYQGDRPVATFHNPADAAAAVEAFNATRTQEQRTIVSKPVCEHGKTRAHRFRVSQAEIVDCPGPNGERIMQRGHTRSD